MATFTRFEDMESWQVGRQITREVYAATGRGACARDYALRDQMRRACVSITSNIAEGFERGGTPEFLHFLSQAKGSVGELRSQLYVALDQTYLTQPQFERLRNLAEQVSRLLAGLMTYLRQTPLRGAKYHPSTTPKP